MALTLMYITNNPKVAEIAQMAGVDRIWVDMEYKGKEERQAGMNTVKSHHTIEDVRAIRSVVNKSALMVRVNPIDEESEEEINAVIEAGAEYVMLPMFKTREEVEKFINFVGGRAKTILLVETAEAAENILSYIDLPGIDEVHIGLNDLHLAYKKKFMFELLTDGTVERLCAIFKGKGITYGFGGIARVGYGMLPAEKIITEHYRLGSTRAILSRGFCDANRVENPEEIRGEFIEGVKNIRLKEQEIEGYSEESFAENRKDVEKNIKGIVRKIIK